MTPLNPELRASDADREAAAARLQVASVEGRIDADELEERLAAAYAARTVGELDRLTLDLLPPPPPAPLPPANPPVPYVPTTNGLAVASLVAGFFWVMWLGSVCAVIFGHVALNQIKESGGTQQGQGLAITGLVLGYLGLASALLVLLAIAF